MGGVRGSSASPVAGEGESSKKGLLGVSLIGEVARILPFFGVLGGVSAAWPLLALPFRLPFIVPKRGSHTQPQKAKFACRPSSRRISDLETRFFGYRVHLGQCSREW